LPDTRHAQSLQLSPDTTDTFQLHNFRLTQFLNIQKIIDITTFFDRAEFFLSAMKAQRNEAEGKIRLGDKRGGGAVMWRPIRFFVLEFVCRLAFLTTTYILGHVFTPIRPATDLPEWACSSQRLSTASFRIIPVPRRSA